MPSQRYADLLGTDNQDRMVTRQARIDAFHEGVPQTDQSLELLARITSALMSFLSRVDGGAVLGKARKQASPSKRQWSVGACVDGIGTHVHGQILNI
jgi:hypothetical protein